MPVPSPNVHLSVAILALASALPAQHSAPVGLTLEPLATHHTSGGGVAHVVFSVDGCRAVTLGDGGDLILWGCGGTRWQVLARADADTTPAPPYRKIWRTPIAVHPTKPWVVCLSGTTTTLLDLSAGSSRDLPSLTYASFDHAGTRLAGSDGKRLVVLVDHGDRVETEFEADGPGHIGSLFFRDLDGCLVVNHTGEHSLHRRSNDGWSVVETRTGSAQAYRGDDPVNVSREEGAVSRNGLVVHRTASTLIVDDTAVATDTSFWMVSISPRGDVLATDKNGRSHLYDAEGGEQVVDAHASDAIELTVSRDGRFVAARTVHGGVILQVAHADGPAWSHEGEVAFARGPQGPEFWVVCAREMLRVNPHLTEPIERVAFPAALLVSLDPKHDQSDMTGTARWSVRQVAADESGERFFFRESSGPLAHLQYAAVFTRGEAVQHLRMPDTDGRLDNAAVVWSDAAERLAVSQSTPMRVPSAADGLRADGADGAVWVFDGNGELTGSHVSPHEVTALAFDSTGDRLAFADRSAVYLADGTTLEIRKKRPLGSRDVLWLAFVDDDLLIACDDETLNAFSVPDLVRQPIAGLEHLTALGVPTASALSVDGRTLAVAANGRVATFRLRRAE